MNIINNNGFKGLFTSKSHKKGEVVMVLTGDILPYPTRTSIQIGESKHIEDKLGQYVNHDCQPSVEVKGNHLVALRDLNETEEVTFNYNVSETDMSSPFTCHCCGKLINGYAKASQSITV
ncbi:SET domain-containing protein-lysine N-methyltransferase [Microscilla marina]|nr:SET domain-containing protein [Microscilla marina]